MTKIQNFKLLAFELIRDLVLVICYFRLTRVRFQVLAWLLAGEAAD